MFFFPFDLPPFVNRTLRLVRPRLFIMMETEIWPNLLRACRQQGVKTMLVNGRISSRSYPRYRLARGFFRRVLADVDRFCMQSDESARRIIDIGADPARVTVTGSLKFESLESPASMAGRGAGRVLRFFRVPESRPVFIAASTLKGEEAPVLAAFAAVRRAHPSALLVIAPRKPERFAEAEALARAEGLRVVRRTELARRRRAARRRRRPRHDRRAGARCFRIATVVFVGGSLVDQGGHNILEPAVARQADRVRAAHAELRGDRATRSCRTRPPSRSPTPAELPAVVVRLIGDPVERARLGAAARALVEANRGAKPRTLAAIADLLPPPGTPRRRRAVSDRGTDLFSTVSGPSVTGVGRRPSGRGRPLAPEPPKLWKTGPTPCVSVGNLAMGGRGKTPVVALLARLLLEAGERPAILSRGYRPPPSRGRRRRRQRRQPSCADLDRSGDEPLMLARAVPGAMVLVCDVRARRARRSRTARSAPPSTCWTTGFSIARRARRRPRPRRAGRPRRPARAVRPAARAACARWRARTRVIVDGDPATRRSPRALGAVDLRAGLRAAAHARRAAQPIERARRRARAAATRPSSRSPASRGPSASSTRSSAAGWRVARRRWRSAIIIAFTARDRRATGGRGARRAARRRVTTEKDAVRLLPLRPLPVPIAAVSARRLRRARPTRFAPGCSARAARRRVDDACATLRHRARVRPGRRRPRRRAASCRTRWPAASAPASA